MSNTTSSAVLDLDLLLDAPAVPRAGAFQPKIKARVRKGGASASSAAKPPAVVPAAVKPSPVVSSTSSIDGNLSGNNAEKGLVWSSSSTAPGILVPGGDNGTQESVVTQRSEEKREVTACSLEGKASVSEVVPTVAVTSTSTCLPSLDDFASTQGSSIAPESSSVVLRAEEGTSSILPPSLDDFPFTKGSSITPGSESVLLCAEGRTPSSDNLIREISPPVAVRSNFPLPVPFAAAELAEEPLALGSSETLVGQEGDLPTVPESARPAKIKNTARNLRKTAIIPVVLPSTTLKEVEVDDDLEETLVSLDNELIAKLAAQEELPVSGRKRKRAFPHSTSRPRGQRADGAGSSKASYDLSNPGILPLREVIRRAENIERKKAKEDLARISLMNTSKPAKEVVKEPEPPRDVLSLAPQVQVINGRIVVNEQSLTVGAYATTAQDTERYTRVEENASRLNYHTYSNRTVTERWKAEETDIFYRAIKQFGTDFDLIQNLFPNRTRRQIKAKFKKEERDHSRRLSDALTYRPKDQTHYEEMLSRIKPDDMIEDNGDPFSWAREQKI